MTHMAWPRGGNIVLAAQHGVLGALRHHLRTDPGAVAATDGFGFTALHRAARHGHVEICRVLLAANVQVGAWNIHGLSVGTSWSSGGFWDELVSGAETF